MAWALLLVLFNIMFSFIVFHMHTEPNLGKVHLIF